MKILSALLILAICLGCFLLVQVGLQARVPALSAVGRSIDAQFALTLLVTGIAFVGVQGVLLLALLRGGRGGRSRHENVVFERLALVVVGAVFLFLAVRGSGVWARMWSVETSDTTVEVGVVAEQFVWTLRHPGPDGVLGRDDIVLPNELVVPVDRLVVLSMSSRDVIHSFFVPALRLKQDVVPGLVTRLAFQAERPGRYEIACAELCGLGHYRMRAVLRVLPQAEYERWLGGER